MSAFLAAGWVAIGALLIRGVWLAVQDARSGKLEIVRLCIEEARPAPKVGQHIYFRDTFGQRQHGVIPGTWALGALPREVELWRASHSKTALRLRIEGEPIEYSVLGPAQPTAGAPR